MDVRKQKMLQLVVENYIDTAEPVGSQFLIERAGLDVSGATVRNEMRELEEEGYLMHPHTSAGRVPTEAGFRYYIDNLAAPESLKKKDSEEILKILPTGKNSDEAAWKNVGRQLAGFVNNAVLLSWFGNRMYYTGLSNLFGQPEFRNHIEAVSMSAVFDECERRIDDVYDLVTDVSVLIGKENPLGQSCGTVAARLNQEMLIAVVGPMRMNYNRCLAVMSLIRKNIK